jgi:hypothetical protein
MKIVENFSELYFMLCIFDLEYYFLDQYSAFYLENNLHFLKHYDIHNQFQEVGSKNVNIFDFNNIFTECMIEAKFVKCYSNNDLLFFENGMCIIDVYGSLPFAINDLPDLHNGFLNNDLLKDLPDWLVPVEINDNLNLGLYQHLIQGNGNIINEKGEVIGGWGLYIDLVKYFDFEWFVDNI